MLFHLVYLVQAAPQRSLTLKTWWFPFVGEQPYLGFFDKKPAQDLEQQLQNEGYDTTLGGVQAFSLLGYASDPVYSSMLDHNTVAEFTEVLIHENVHRTLYIPNHTSFNENLADFVAKRGTVQFLKTQAHDVLAESVGSGAVETYEHQAKQTYEATLRVQDKFQSFLKWAKEDLTDFYRQAAHDPDLQTQDVFLKERKKHFDHIADAYLSDMKGLQHNTPYEGAFAKGTLNNARILSYALYEAKQQPFHRVLHNCHDDLRCFLQKLQLCLKDKNFDSEEKLWSTVSLC